MAQAAAETNTGSNVILFQPPPKSRRLIWVRVDAEAWENLTRAAADLAALGTKGQQS